MKLTEEKKTTEVLSTYELYTTKAAGDKAHAPGKGTDVLESRLNMCLELSPTLKINGVYDKI